MILYIAIIPGIDFCLDYCSLCEINKEILHKHSLNYIFTKQIGNAIHSHQYLHVQLARLLKNNKDKEALSNSISILKKFDTWAENNKEDILLCFDAGLLGILSMLKDIIQSEKFPFLSQYTIRIVFLFCPQEESLEGALRFHGPRLQEISPLQRKERFLLSSRTRLDLLYTEAAQLSDIPPRVLLADTTQRPDEETFFRCLDREIPKEEIQPLPATALYDRHAVTFLYELERFISIQGIPPYREMAAALHTAGIQTWSDSRTWMPPQILQEIREVSKEGNQRLARQLFNREELFEPPCSFSHNWEPYQGLTPELRVRLLSQLMKESPSIRRKLETIFSCRWQYSALSMEGKRLFPDPNSPQALAREPLVSVLTLTRNQASMIAENMESVLAQQTRFPFQHIIVDDSSKDGTQDIITEYAARYPQIIKPILLKHKAPHGENVRALFEQCRSKYAVLCDGDDYFTDPGKLQTQVDFMERNPDCALCFHPVSVVYEDGTPTKTYPPADLLPGGERLWYTLRDLLISNFIQTNSVMYRWRFQGGLPKWFDPTLIPGDWYWHLLHAETGKIAYLRKPMSAYRRHAASLYARAEKDHVAHRHEHGLNELRAYNVCNAHFRNRYYKDFSRLARGVFADFVQDYLKTKDDGLLQEGIAAAPDFARDFLSLLASQNMHLPPTNK